MTAVCSECKGELCDLCDDDLCCACREKRDEEDEVATLDAQYEVQDRLGRAQRHSHRAFFGNNG